MTEKNRHFSDERPAAYDQGEEHIPVDRKEVHRCPHCGEIFCTGHFGRGTVIEVKCKRGRCKKMFRIAKP